MRDVRRPEGMNVIGHDDPRTQSAPAIGSGFSELFFDEERDFRPPEVERTSPATVEEPVPCDESLAGCEVFAAKGALLWQASTQAPGDEDGLAWSIAMRQAASIGPHATQLVD